jgi:hypothetical protein
MDGRPLGKPLVTRLLVPLMLAGIAQPAAAPSLQIDVTMPREATGTMHFADRVVIRLPGIEPLTFDGSPVPVYDDQFALSATRYLLLGWSSTEGTNQTLTVSLVERRANRLAEVTSMRFTSSRPDSMLLIRQSAGGARIGIFAPERPTRMAIEVGIVDPWAIHNGRQSLALRDGLRAKTDRVTALTPADRFYAPTMKPALPGRGVIWFDVGTNEFRRRPN